MLRKGCCDFSTPPTAGFHIGRVWVREVWWTRRRPAPEPGRRSHRPGCRRAASLFGVTSAAEPPCRVAVCGPLQLQSGRGPLLLSTPRSPGAGPQGVLAIWNAEQPGGPGRAGLTPRHLALSGGGFPQVPVSLCSQAVLSSAQTATRQENGTSLGRDMSLAVEVRKRERRLGLPQEGPACAPAAGSRGRGLHGSPRPATPAPVPSPSGRCVPSGPWAA